MNECCLPNLHRWNPARLIEVTSHPEAYAQGSSYPSSLSHRITPSGIKIGDHLGATCHRHGPIP